MPLVERNAHTTQRCAIGRSRDIACKPEYRHTDLAGTRSFWCTEHEQWITVYPVSVNLTYFYGDDGSSTSHVGVRANFVPMEGYQP